MSARPVCEDERRKTTELLDRYGFKAPEDGGTLRFVGEDPDDLFDWGEDAEEDIFIEGEDDAAGEEGEEDEEEEGDKEEDEDEEEEEDEETMRRREDLQKRMEGLDIENAEFEDIWERLDSREREAFVKLANDFDKEHKDSD